MGLALGTGNKAITVDLVASESLIIEPILAQVAIEKLSVGFHTQ